MCLIRWNCLSQKTFRESTVIAIQDKRAPASKKLICLPGKSCLNLDYIFDQKWDFKMGRTLIGLFPGSARLIIRD